jgi:hypothetical protein
VVDAKPGASIEATRSVTNDGGREIRSRSHEPWFGLVGDSFSRSKCEFEIGAKLYRKHAVNPQTRT